MTRILDWRNDNAVLADLFDWLGDKEISYFVNPGNAGDGLIAQGTYDLFRQNKIFWTPARKENVSGKIVVIAGGGNLVSFYGACREIAEQAFQHAKMTIILPHTIRDQAELLKLAGPSAHIFCRDVPSFEHVKQHVNGARVSMAHDLAFFCDTSGILEDKELNTFWEAKLASILKARGIDSPQELAEKEMECFRADIEKTSMTGGPGNIDISNVFKTGTFKKKVRGGTYMFLRFIQSCGSIATNRLHVGIGSAIMGTKATLYDNSYGKISAVYDYSLKDRYPGVEFAADK
ncbi:polysaccharide pyruvyl transferase family protein [Pararoseomonas sp. SCSIO 73927]|uniref:polysaccharide pyruvyl transferase family protein n=1 Tax=Pararoseomonas sp. SCSIO 73927 TaxID=3114537 RepID=UPI0030CDD0A8